MGGVRLITFCIAVFMHFFNTANAQTEVFFNEQREKDKVYQITQDNDGFVWILTDKGMVKYDGQKYRLYAVTDGLPTNDIWGTAITGDKTWYLIKGSEVGYIKDDKVHTFKYANQNLLPLNYIVEDTTLLVYDGDLNLVTLKDGSWQITRKGGVERSRVFYPLKRNFFDGYNVEYDLNNLRGYIQFTNGERIKVLDEKKGLNIGNGIHLIKQFPNDVCCILRANKLIFINGRTKQVTTISPDLPKGSFLQANAVRWVNQKIHVTYNGFVGILNDDFEFIQTYTFDTKYNAHANLIDKNGNILLGSFTTGVHFISAKNNKTKT